VLIFSHLNDFDFLIGYCNIYIVHCVFQVRMNANRYGTFGTLRNLERRHDDDADEDLAAHIIPGMSVRIFERVANSIFLIKFDI
jgi:hypothetical protein